MATESIWASTLSHWKASADKTSDKQKWRGMDTPENAWGIISWYEGIHP